MKIVKDFREVGEDVVDLVLDYPEFGYKVTYHTDDSETIEWEVRDTEDRGLMLGSFYSDNYYRSTFNMISDVTENTYESLFYLYFENIKPKCIDIVEFKDINNTEIDEEFLPE